MGFLFQKGVAVTQQEIEKLLADIGAIITGSHIVYAKGGHGSAYVNKDVLYEDPRNVSKVCAEMAGLIFRRVRELGLDQSKQLAIVAPAVGGVALSQWTTFHVLGLGLKAVALYADKTDDGHFEIRRGYEKKVANADVIVVEDVLNTGGSAAEAVKAVQLAGGNVIQVVALCNRGGVTAEGLGVAHLSSLVNVTLDVWSPSDCPLCKQGVPINTTIGHGAAFLRAMETLRRLA